MDSIEIINRARRIIGSWCNVEDLLPEDTWAVSAALEIAVLLDQRNEEYENLKKQGRLVVLPCKVGDVVYITDHWGKKVDKFRVNWITYDGEKIMCWEHRDLQCVTPDIWGKTVFLTREEAEAALGGTPDERP